MTSKGSLCTRRIIPFDLRTLPLNINQKVTFLSLSTSTYLLAPLMESHSPPPNYHSNEFSPAFHAGSGFARVAEMNHTSLPRCTTRIIILCWLQDQFCAGCVTARAATGSTTCFSSCARPPEFFVQAAAANHAAPWKIVPHRISLGIRRNRSRAALNLSWRHAMGNFGVWHAPPPHSFCMHSKHCVSIIDISTRGMGCDLKLFPLRADADCDSIESQSVRFRLVIMRCESKNRFKSGLIASFLSMDRLEKFSRVNSKMLIHSYATRLSLVE